MTPAESGDHQDRFPVEVEDVDAAFADIGHHGIVQLPEVILMSTPI